MSLSQGLVQSQDHFLSSLGIFALQRSGGLSRLCHCLSQPIYGYSWSRGNWIVSLSSSLSFGQVGHISLSQLQLRKQSSSATSGHFGHPSSELPPLCLSVPGSDLKPSCLLTIFPQQHTSYKEVFSPKDRGCCLGFLSSMLLSSLVSHRLTVRSWAIKVCLWCLRSNAQRTRAILFSNLQ